MDVTDTNDFHEWLKQKDESTRKEQFQRIHLELPNPSDYPRESKPTVTVDDNRGVTVIDLF